MRSTTFYQGCLLSVEVAVAAGGMAWAAAETKTVPFATEAGRADVYLLGRTISGGRAAAVSRAMATTAATAMAAAAAAAAPPEKVPPKRHARLRTGLWSTVWGGSAPKDLPRQPKVIL